MKALITPVLLALAVSLANGVAPSIQDAWTKEDMSPGQRAALVERSKEEPFFRGDRLFSLSEQIT